MWFLLCSWTRDYPNLLTGVQASRRDFNKRRYMKKSYEELNNSKIRGEHFKNKRSHFLTRVIGVFVRAWWVWNALWVQTPTIVMWKDTSQSKSSKLKDHITQRKFVATNQIEVIHVKANELLIYGRK